MRRWRELPKIRLFNSHISNMPDTEDSLTGFRCQASGRLGGINRTERKEKMIFFIFDRSSLYNDRRIRQE